MNARTASRIAWSAWLVTVVLVVVALTLLVTNGLPSGQDLIFTAAFILMTFGYSTVGALIASRHQRNPIGWLFMLVAFGFAFAGFAEDYAVRALITAPGSLPAAAAVLWVQTPLLTVAVAGIPLALLLFPTGRVPSPRWRWVARAMITAPLIGIAGQAINPGLVGGDRVKVPNPVGIEGLQGVAGILLTVAGIGSVIAAFACVVGLVVRFRRVRGDERQQLRWLAYVGVAAGVLFLGPFVSGFLGGEDAVNQAFFLAFFTTLALGIPAASAVAILKYRLYDLDLVVKKTVVFGVLATVITLVYVAVVIGIPALVVGFGADTGGALPAIAVGVVALLFQPLRNRARRMADRVVYGKRATPYEVLSAFSDRLGVSFSAEDVLPEMARMIGEGTGARRAEVWLRIGSELRLEAEWPSKISERRDVLSSTGQELPTIASVDEALEVRHQGELLGAIAVAMPANDPLTQPKRRLLQDLAAQAGLVLRNVRLIEELRGSRQRLVAAHDEERRRLERNIHDGAQQQLVALAVKLGLAETLSDRDPARTKAILGELKVETQDALDNLRDLARGIYPPLLADKGLLAALEAQARKAAVPVRIEADGIGRFPQDAEAAVYFCVLEALQNVAKYAEARNAVIRLSTQDENLVFEVRDDGRGFDPEKTRPGSGLTNMADRIEALGGTLDIRSKPGQGTTVAGKVPVSTIEPTRRLEPVG